MLAIWTYDWVPEGKTGPRGFVRDLRLRWACEEAGLTYRIKTTPFEDRGPDHIARQPFGQAPFLEDNGITIFESGACLLHLARKSEKLMPRDPVGEADTLQWTIAALNSVEMVSVPWAFLSWSEGPDNALSGWLASRLEHVDAKGIGRAACPPCTRRCSFCMAPPTRSILSRTGRGSPTRWQAHASLRLKAAGTNCIRRTGR